MTPRLSALRSRQVIQALRKAGFEVDHQTGAHVALYRVADRRCVIVPRHNRDLGRGLLRKIIADAGLTREKSLRRLYDSPENTQDAVTDNDGCVANIPGMD